MLARIDLQHFKCFALLKLPLRPLTLLSGANASGKSSVLQALVLLHQTVREHEMVHAWPTRLMLNGEAMRLGAAAAKTCRRAQTSMRNGGTIVSRCNVSIHRTMATMGGRGL